MAFFTGIWKKDKNGVEFLGSSGFWKGRGSKLGLKQSQKYYLIVYSFL